MPSRMELSHSVTHSREQHSQLPLRAIHSMRGIVRICISDYRLQPLSTHDRQQPQGWPAGAFDAALPFGDEVF